MVDTTAESTGVARDKTDWDLADAYLSARPTKWRSLSWIAARTLIRSVNDRLVHFTHGLVGDLRTHWVNGRALEELCVDRRDRSSFIVAGDPGEQDGSQYVVAPALACAAQRDDIGFVLLLSDVIYPSGDVNDYVDGFYKPYFANDADPKLRGKEPERFQVGKPVYAIPGNHDWYDGLFGFAYHFLLTDETSTSARRRFELKLAPDPTLALGFRARVADRFGRTMWRRTSDADKDTRPHWRRVHPPGEVSLVGQPGPYFVIETKHVDLVCIDTGVDGWIDEEQRDWMEAVCEAARERPRVLMTGKPLLVNGEDKSRRASPESSFGWLKQHVDEKKNGYVAVVGGDVHNFQQYSDSSGVLHLVSGGAGAYTHATHPIPLTALDPRWEITESPKQKRGLFPAPAESLSYFTSQLVPSVWRLSRAVFWYAAALVATYYLRDLDRTWSVFLPGYTITLGFLGIAVVAAVVLLGVRSLLPAAPTSPGRRLVAVLLMVAIGAVTTLFSLRHLPETTRPLLQLYLFSTGWLCLNAAGLRLTEWWRPVQRGTVDWWRHVAFWFGLVATVVVAVLAAEGLGGVGIEDVAAVAVFCAMAIRGWLYRVSDTDPFGPGSDPRSATWLSHSVMWAVGAQALVIVVILGDILLTAGHPAILLSGGTAALILLVSVVVCALLPLGAEGALRGDRTDDDKRRRWLAGARVIRMLVLATPPVVVAFAGYAAHATGFLELRAGFGPAALVVVVAASAIGIDMLRRRVGAGYPWLVAAVVLAITALLYDTQWYDAWPVVAVAGSLLAVIALVTSILAAHLVFVGALWLLVYWAHHRTPSQGQPRTPGENAHWRFLDEADTEAIIAARQTARLELIESEQRPTRRGWRLARIAFPGLNPPFGPIQRFVSEIFSLDEPPFFKHFLEFTSTEDDLFIHVHTVRGDLPSERSEGIRVPLRKPAGHPTADDGREA